MELTTRLALNVVVRSRYHRHQGDKRPAGIRNALRKANPIHSYLPTAKLAAQEEMPPPATCVHEWNPVVKALVVKALVVKALVVNGQVVNGQVVNSPAVKDQWSRAQIVHQETIIHHPASNRGSLPIARVRIYRKARCVFRRTPQVRFLQELVMRQRAIDRTFWTVCGAPKYSGSLIRGKIPTLPVTQVVRFQIDEVRRHSRQELHVATSVGPAPVKTLQVLRRGHLD